MAEQQEKKKGLRINPIVAMLMVIFAFVLDAVQFLAILFFASPLSLAADAINLLPGGENMSGLAVGVGVSWYAGVVGILGFFFLFKFMDISLTEGKGSLKKIFAFGGMSALEFIPPFSAFPFFTITITWILAQIMIENIGLELDLIDVAALFVPVGGEAFIAARTAAKAGKVAATEQKIQKATSTARKAASTSRQPDFGPGTKKPQPQMDINTPYRPAEEEESADFAQPYVPTNDDEESGRSRWTA